MKKLFLTLLLILFAITIALGQEIKPYVYNNKNVHLIECNGIEGDGTIKKLYFIGLQIDSSINDSIIFKVCNKSVEYVDWQLKYPLTYKFRKYIKEFDGTIVKRDNIIWVTIAGECRNTYNVPCAITTNIKFDLDGNIITENGQLSIRILDI